MNKLSKCSMNFNPTMEKTYYCDECSFEWNSKNTPPVCPQCGEDSGIVMVCPSCGMEIPTDAKVCEDCGEEL